MCVCSVCSVVISVGDTCLRRVTTLFLTCTNYCTVPYSLSISCLILLHLFPTFSMSLSGPLLSMKLESADSASTKPAALLSNLSSLFTKRTVRAAAVALGLVTLLAFFTSSGFAPASLGSYRSSRGGEKLYNDILNQTLGASNHHHILTKDTSTRSRPRTHTHPLSRCHTLTESLVRETVLNHHALQDRFAGLSSAGRSID